MTPTCAARPMAPPTDDRWCGVPVGDCTGRFLALLEAAGGDTNETGGRAPIDDDDPSWAEWGANLVGGLGS